MLLQACLNGARRAGSHPALPLSPQELAVDAARVTAEGADVVHVHPRDGDGRESLDGEVIGAAVDAIRSATGVPVGVSTGAWIVANPQERIAAIRSWSVLPDYASVNLHEDGAVDVARALLDRGVGIEVGVWDEPAAAALVGSGLIPSCLRILLEPMDATVPDALATVAAIEATLPPGGPPRLLHGVGATAWELLTEAGRRALQARIGLEDARRLPDGSVADDNAALVRAAKAILMP